MAEASIRIGAVALLVLAIIVGLRARRDGVAVGAMLIGGALGLIAIAGLLNSGTNGRIGPPESIPWLSLIWLVVSVLVLRLRLRLRIAAAARPATVRVADAARPIPGGRRRDPTIFLSYRRSDSQDVTGRIYDRLVQHFGREHVFKDVDNIPLGVDFRRFVGERVGSCDVLLAVIGPGWLSAGGDQGRRLDDSRDLVRAEIASALKRDIPVVPVLVGGADVPDAAQLPDELRALSDRNGIRVGADPDFHRDVDRLLDGLAKVSPAPGTAPFSVR